MKQIFFKIFNNLHISSIIWNNSRYTKSNDSYYILNPKDFTHFNAHSWSILVNTQNEFHISAHHSLFTTVTIALIIRFTSIALISEPQTETGHFLDVARTDKVTLSVIVYFEWSPAKASLLCRCFSSPSPTWRKKYRLLTRATYWVPIWRRNCLLSQSEFTFQILPSDATAANLAITTSKWSLNRFVELDFEFWIAW